MRAVMRSSGAVWTGVVALIVGCGDGAETAAGDQLPADVARVIEQRCVSCHSQPAQYGAPMPLLTYADTQRAAASDPTRRVWQLMAERVRDPQRPMPPSRLDEADAQVIERWAAAGARGCSGSGCGTVRGGTVSSPDARLPCTPTRRFLAHGEGSAPAWRVPARSGNTNKCFAFRSPFNGTTQGTAFAARVDNSRVLHHIILFSTETPQQDGRVFDCDGNMPRDARFVAGWAPGNMGSVMPADVGVELPGPNGYFILQAHYWNTTADAGDDQSGIALCTTDVPRPHAAAVHTLGTLNLAIPPRQRGFEATGSCTPAGNTPIHVVGTGPHMHRLGVALRTEVLRGGDARRMEMLTEVDDYSFDNQVGLTSDMVLMPGDVLRTTCRYDNNTDRTVYFGERTEDEMCFNFVLAWPAGALATAAGTNTRRCIDPTR